MRIHLSLVACVVVALTSSCIGATNPFDPQTPAATQARSVVVVRVIDAGGVVIADARVTLKDQDGALRQGIADADGAQRVEDIVAGVAELSVAHPDYFSAARDLVLLPGETRALDVVLIAIDAGGQGTGRVTGVARKGAETNQLAEFQDHSGVVIEVAGTGTRTTTNAAGAFDVFLLPGTYSVALSARDHLPTTISGIVVSAGATTTLDAVTLPINPGGAAGSALLEGRETDATAHAGIIVSLVDGSVTTTTAADGSWVLPNLPPGIVTLRFVSSSGHDVVERVVTVAAGRQLALEPVVLPRSRGAIAGRIDLLGRADDGDALVLLSGDALFGLTGSDGRFLISSVPTGVREVTVSADGFSRVVRGGITVEAGRTVDIGTVALAAGGGDFDINGGDAFTQSEVVTIELDSDDALQMRVSEDPTFGDVALPVAFAARSNFTLSGGDGEKTIFVELIDSAGAVIDVLAATITIDTTPPEQVSVSINGGAAFSNNADGLVSLTIVASDATSGVEAMQISLDAGFDEPFEDIAATKVIALSPNTDGTRGVFVRFRDRAGNTTAAVDAATDTIVLDRVAPSASVQLNGGAALTASPFVTLTVALGPGSGDAEFMAVSTDVQVPDPVFTPFAASSTVLVGTTSGSQGVGVKLRDRAGNVSGAFTDTIELDQTPPGAVVLRLDGGAAFTRDTDVALSLTSDDPTAQVRIAVDGQLDTEPFVAVTPSSVIVPGGDGQKTVLAQLRDAAGNLSVVAAASIVLDTAAPVLGGTPVVINGGEAFTRSVSVTVALDVADATEMQIVTNGATNASGGFVPFSTTAVALLPAGDCVVADCKAVCAIFRDGAGNVTPERCANVTLDTAVPSTPILVEGDSTISTDVFSFALASPPSDAFFSHIEVLVQPSRGQFVELQAVAGRFRIPSADLLTPAEAGLTTSALAVREHTLRVRAVDRAGNVSPETAIAITIDDVPPNTPELAGLPRGEKTPNDPNCPAIARVNADTVQVNFTSPAVASADATFSHYEVQGDLGSGNPNVPSPVDTTVQDGILFSLAPNARNTLRITAIDAAGLRSAPAIVCVFEDSSAPTQPLISPSDGIVRANAVDVFLVTAATDARADLPCTLSSQCPPGGRCEANQCVVPVDTYEVKDGRGLGFSPVPSATGPFTAQLSNQSDQTEICVRGVDVTGNPGIEDCVTVTNARTSEIVAPVDQARQFDVFGDFVAFAGGNQRMILRDLRGGFDDLELSNPFDPADLRADRQVRVDGTGVKLNIVFDLANVASTSAIARVDATLGVPSTQIGVFSGKRPDVQGSNVVYIVPATVDPKRGTIFRRSTTPPADGNPDPDLDPPVVDIDRVRVSDVDVELCEDTGPRVFDGVVIWCEVVAGTPRVRRRLLDSSGSPTGLVETLNDANPVATRLVSSLEGSTTAINQPVISDLFIAWVERRGGDNRLVVRALNQNGALPVPGANARALSQSFVFDTTVNIDQLNDASGQSVVGVQALGLFNDVVAVDLLRAPLERKRLTEDPPPQSQPAVDGGRIAFNDVSTGSRVLMIDRTDTRWVAATPELEFEPITSTDATVWLSLFDDEICLLARLVNGATAPIRIVDGNGECEVPVFAGPTESDPLWAIGGTRVAYVVATGPTSFSLRVFDVSTRARITVSNSASETITMDPDGDAIAWVEANGTVMKATLGANLQVTATSLGNPGGPGVPIPHVDIDDDLVVVQVGGDRNRRNDPGLARCRDASDGAFRDVRIGGAALTAKGPKIARTRVGGVAGPIVLSFIDTTTNGRACTSFTCAGGCSSTFAVGGGVNNDQNLRVARDGNVVLITSEVGLRQALLMNVFTGNRFFVGRGIESERQGLDVAERRVVWGDFQLGDRDVWELTIP